MKEKPDKCPECGSTNLTKDESISKSWYCLCCGFGLALEKEVESDEE